MIKKAKAVILAALAGLLNGCAMMRTETKMRPQTVEAMGEARLDSQNRPLSRAKALARAEKAALEKALGVRISEATQLSASIVSHEAIDAESSGMINHYKILKEGESGSVYQVEIEATVSPLPADDRRQVSLFSKAPPDSQPLTIRLNGDIEGSRLGELALSAVEAGFKKRGFSFEDSDKTSGRFVVTTQGFSSKFIHSPLLGRLHSCRAKIDIQIQDTLSHNLIIDRWVEAAGVGGSEDIALERALSNASRKAGIQSAEELAQDLWAQL